MKTLTVEELQRDLPAVVALVRGGETLTVTEGESATPVMVLNPAPVPATGKRRVGFLKGQIVMQPLFKMTEEEFLGWEEVVPAASPNAPVQRRRVLGRLAGRGEFRFGPDFEMSDEELLGDASASS